MVMEMENVHKTCRCLGRLFTFEEWSDYCKAHPHSDGEIVHTSPSGYGFNIHDVCLNPDIDVQVEYGQVGFTIKTAQSDNGRWECGYHATIPRLRVMLHPCCFVNRKDYGYETKKEAVFDALKSIRKTAEYEIDILNKYRDQLPDGSSYSILRAELNGFVRMIDKEKGLLSFVQLELF